jgi:hypothetical protein
MPLYHFDCQPQKPLASGLTLVTNNENELRRVRGLRIQNWTTSQLRADLPSLVYNYWFHALIFNLQFWRNL